MFHQIYIPNFEWNSIAEEQDWIIFLQDRAHYTHQHARISHYFSCILFIIIIIIIIVISWGIFREMKFIIRLEIKKNGVKGVGLLCFVIQMTISCVAFSSVGVQFCISRLKNSHFAGKLYLHNVIYFPFFRNSKRPMH